MSKRCADCRVEITAFTRCVSCRLKASTRAKAYADSARAQGLCTKCKAPATSGTLCERHREAQNRRSTAWRRANVEAHRSATSAWYFANSERLNAKRVAARYGMTPEQWQEMYEAQGGACAICGEDERVIANSGKRVKRLAIDHCHESGRVRGLLCNNCNRAIGLFGDSPEAIRKALDYLVEHKAVI